MLTIYILRHGQDLDNARGILNGRRNEPLSYVGLSQARQLAKKVRERGLRFDAVYSSPLQRAFQTAEAIIDALGLPKPVLHDGLIERDFGIMTGRPANDIERICAPDIIKTDTVTYFLSPEGAETFPQLVERAQRVLVWIVKSHADGNILLVTHGDFGKMVYAAYYGIEWQNVLMMFHFGNTELLKLSKDSPADESHVFKVQQHNN